MNQRIENGEYEETADYDTDKVLWRKQRRDLEQKFRNDLAEAYGVQDHPKRIFCGLLHGTTDTLMVSMMF